VSIIRKLLVSLRNFFIVELILYLSINPSDLERFFLFDGIMAIILCLFSIVNVIVDGRTLKIGRGFSSGGGYVNHLLIAKLLQTVYGTEKLYDRGKGIQLDIVNIVIFLGGMINILIYFVLANT